MDQNWLTKLAGYLDSFGPEEPNYDYVCYLKSKLAFDGTQVAQNTDTELDDADITTSNTEGDQGNQNVEGGLMEGAFKDLDLLNREQDKEEAVAPEGAKPEGNQNSPAEGIGIAKQASAYIKDVAVKDLPKDTQADIRKFLPVTPNTKLVHYGMVVRELLPKADQTNLKSAQQHIKDQTVKLEDVLEKAKTKYILMVNEEIIDGHHFLAKAQKADVTSSLNVLDLTPARFQKQASLLDDICFKL